MPSELRLPGQDPADHTLARLAFDRAMIEFGVAAGRATEIRLGLERRYRERGRHYHTLDHVASMARLAVAHRSALRDPNAVTLAIWYHDALYRPRRADNEARSAALAREELGGLIPSRALDTIERLILATATHEPVAAADSGSFLDFDLAILASEPAVYDAYARAIRAEYRWVPAAIYRRKRGEVLRGLLDRGSIYVGGVFGKGWEEAARENLSRELRAGR